MNPSFRRRTAPHVPAALSLLVFSAFAHAADPPEDRIFFSDFERIAPVCVTSVPVTRVFTNTDPSVFFNVAWQQQTFAEACPAPHEMLALNEAACEEQPGHNPPRHICRASACCGAPPPVPPCDQSADNGLPAGAIDVEPATEVDETRGLLSVLYPDRDTRTDAFHGGLPCAGSIGEEPIPPEVDTLPPAEDLAALETLKQYETSDGAALAAAQNSSRPPDALSPAPIADDICWRRFSSGNWDIVDCAQQLHPDQPFDGRDVIYVHGLATGHLKNWLGNYSPAQQRWPQDAQAFTQPGGYFHDYANDYWRDHIREHLWATGASVDPLAGWQWWAGDATPIYRPKKNRYLVVAWSSNQGLAYAQNAFLVQVTAAINAGTNVVTPPNFPADERRPFCANGCVVISHSTGGLLVSSALGAVERGDYGPDLRALSRHLRVHVAFNGALSGSRLATAALSLARSLPNPGRTRLCALVGEVFDDANLCSSLDTAFLEQSILKDLMPSVAQRVWGPLLSRSPVPTLTVAGGHPVGNYTTATKLLLPGIDDGVVSANAACGNPNAVAPDGGYAPSGVVVGSLRKSFDLGDNVGRAVKNLISQKHLMDGARPGGPFYLAGLCTPYLSATGMVLPVEDALAGTPWDTRARWPNHYSLIQSVADHAYDGGGSSSNPWPSAAGQVAGIARHYKSDAWLNREESSAVTDAGIYRQFADGSYLVKPQFADSVELVRGKSIRFRLFRRTRTIWLWKRTYERLNGWETKQSSHYVYEFVARH